MTGAVDLGEADVMPMSMEAHVAVQTVHIQHMTKALDRIEAAQQASVPRSEWEQRNGYVDGRFQQVTDANVALTNALAELKRAIDAARAPWWVVVGAGTGIVSAVVAVIVLITK